MRTDVLQALADKWRADAAPDEGETMQDTEQARLYEQLEQGIKQGKAGCADELLTIIKILE